MTKLYVKPDMQWILPGQQDRRDARVDVPNSPAELAAWLNDRRVPPAPAAIAAPDYGGIAHSQEQLGSIDTPDAPPASPATVPDRVHDMRVAMGQCPACAKTPSAAALAVQSADLDAISAWIFDADTWQVERIFEAIGARFHELRSHAAKLEQEGREA